MYSSEYASGFSGPAASHLAAPLSPRHEGNVGQAPSNMVLRKAKMEKEDLAGWRQENPGGWAVSEKIKIILLLGLDFTRLHQ
jgi:hypothetical protein